MKVTFVQEDTSRKLVPPFRVDAESGETAVFNSLEEAVQWAKDAIEMGAEYLTAHDAIGKIGFFDDKPD